MAETLPPPPTSLQHIEKEDDGLDGEQKKRADLERSFWSKIWQGIAISSAVLAIAAIVLEGGSIVCIVAGVVSVAVAAVVFKYQLDLEDTDSLRRVQNLLRKDANRLQLENNVLGSEITRLGTTVESLKGNETKLEAIASAQGANAETFVALVKENGIVTAEMDESTRAATLQGLMDVILGTDTNQSFTIGKGEVDMLLLRFKVDPRVTVHEVNFRKRVAAAGGELPLTAVIEDLIRLDGSPEEKMFTIHSHGEKL